MACRSAERVRRAAGIPDLHCEMCAMNGKHSEGHSVLMAPFEQQLNTALSLEVDVMDTVESLSQCLDGRLGIERCSWRRARR